MKRRGNFTNRQFKQMIKSGWGSMTPISDVKNRKSSFWLNCAAAVIIMGLAVSMVLNRGVSPYSPELDEISPQDLISRFCDLL